MIVGDKKVSLAEINHNFSHLVVPAAVEKCEKFRVLGICDRFYCKQVSTVISLEETSEITLIPSSFISYVKSTLCLPLKIKRIKRTNKTMDCTPVISCDTKSSFISAIEEINIMKKHPLELILQHIGKQRL